MNIRFCTVSGMACVVGASLMFGASMAVAQQTSDLWGESGERWDPRGRLPDYSYAGYHSGEKSIPDVPVVTDVTDFGAIPNDGRDDSRAIQAAINATSNGAVFIPKGTFRLEEQILVEKSSVVIRGDGSGPNDTVLYVPENYTERNGGVFNGSAAVGLVGFIIKFEGSKPRGEIDIEAQASRGDRTIRLEDASSFDPGDEILIKLTDTSLYGSLFRHLHNERLSGWSQGTPKASCGASDSWSFTVESVDGDEVTLKEPLPFDIRDEWRPKALIGRANVENGIENLRVRFRYDEQGVHLKELGYNAILFEYTRDSWIRNVAMEDIDNGITISRYSSRNTIKDVTIDGRPGHHLTTFSQSSYNMIDGITVNVDESAGEWIHALTLDHVAQGNVMQRAISNKTLRLDMHRDSTFNNLITEILSKSNFKSGGNRCYGPHTGARLTLWNVDGLFENLDKDLLEGIDSQVNIVTQTDRRDTTSEDGLWVENISDVQPKNLYEAQLALRLGVSAPRIAVSLLSQTVEESDGTVQLVARLSESSSLDVSIEVRSRSGSATIDEDFDELFQAFVIPAGSLEVNVPVSIIDDDVQEDEEQFTVEIVSTAGVEIDDGTATVTITANDVPDDSTPVVTMSSVTINEADREAIVVAELDNARSADVELFAHTRDGTTIEGQDYYGMAGTFVIPAGQLSVNIPVQVLDDYRQEGDEQFMVRIHTVNGESVFENNIAMITIEDNDDGLTPLLSVAPAEIMEGETHAVEVMMSLASDSPVSVRFATDSTDATLGEDYYGVHELITFEPGETNKIVNLITLDDTVAEGDESVLLRLFEPVGAQFDRNRANLLIIDND